MEEKYWNQFIQSGSVRDYLTYRGMAICAQVMREYGAMDEQETGETISEPDNGNRNGSFGYSNWRI